jgi:hypothetical protein
VPDLELQLGSWRDDERRARVRQVEDDFGGSGRERGENYEDEEDDSLVHGGSLLLVVFPWAVGLDGPVVGIPVESFEHEAENALNPGVYPRLALGPGQRFASKGCYVVRLADGSPGGIEAVGGWIVP